MTDWPILTTVTFLPLVGAFLIMWIRDDNASGRRNIRSVTLFTTVFTFVVSLLVWIGFDQVAPLGRQETGARAALPVWMDYMRVALKDMPESEPTLPAGVVTVRIDPSSGAVAGVGNSRAIMETFREKDVPRAGASASCRSTYTTNTHAGRCSIPRRSTVIADGCWPSLASVW